MNNEFGQLIRKVASAQENSPKESDAEEASENPEMEAQEQMAAMHSTQAAHHAAKADLHDRHSELHKEHAQHHRMQAKHHSNLAAKRASK
jgi:hypothetical protein